MTDKDKIKTAVYNNLVRIGITALVGFLSVFFSSLFAPVREIAEVPGEIRELQSAVSKFPAEISELKAAVSEFPGELRELQEVVAKFQATVNTLQQQDSVLFLELKRVDRNAARNMHSIRVMRAKFNILEDELPHAGKRMKDVEDFLKNYK
jgi:chromosome segregation ATPase